jgi:hypothetical protein
MAYRTNAFIDKCSVTIPVPQEHWTVAEHNLSDLPYRNDNCSVARIATHGPRPQLYLTSWTYRPTSADSNGKLYLQALPLIPGIAFMRIEWNPRKIKRDGFRELIELLSSCIPYFFLALSDATITRADITFDVQTGIDRFFVVTHSAATLCSPWFENEDQLNAYYLGSSKAPHKMLVYDKNFEQFQGNKTRSATGKTRLLRNRTRCELRLSRIGKLQDLPSFPNPFHRYIFADRTKATNYPGDANWRRFLRRSISSTAQEAMSRSTTQGERSTYRRALKQCIPNWYDAEEIWAEARAALEDIFLT